MSILHQQYEDTLRENERLRDYAKRATAALREVRPLGGSEMFTRVGEEHYADPDYCGRLIRELRDDLPRLKMALMRAEKAKATV